MPNWCNEYVKVVAQNKDVNALKFIDGVIKKAQKKHKGQDNANWFGYIAEELNFDVEYMRGFINGAEIDVENGEHILFVCSNTAWSPIPEFWEKLIDIVNTKFNSKLRFYYIAEEPGCEVYEKNDDTGKYFSEEYIVDSFADEIESGTFDNFDEAVDWIQSELNVELPDKTLDGINRYFKEKYIDAGLFEYTVNTDYIQTEEE